MRSRAPVAVALASLVALFVVGCGPKAAEGTTTATLDVGGRTRSYAYHLPPQHTPQKKWPLVLALHGRLGTGVGQEKLSALSSIADRDGATRRNDRLRRPCFPGGVSVHPATPSKSDPEHGCGV